MYITIHMSMQHTNIRTPTGVILFFGMFPCSMLIFALHTSMLHGNVQKTKEALLRFWMFPCCMLMCLVI